MSATPRPGRPVPALVSGRGRSGRRAQRHALRWLPALALLLLAGTVYAQEAYIEAIAFRGNETTREVVMRQELTVAPGDPVDREAIEESRRALLDLGLFQAVHTQVEGTGPAKTVVFVVEERYYILPLPRLDADLEDENVSYGLELRLDNLFGLNQRARILYRHREFADDDEETHKLGSVSYSYPRVLGSRFNLAVAFGAKREQVEPEGFEDAEPLPTYRRDTRELDLQLSRWLTDEGPSRGWRVGGGIEVVERDHAFLSGTPGLLDDATVVALEAGVDYLNVRNLLYYRTGEAYGYHLEVGDNALGSDHDFSRHLFYYREYRHLPERRANLNWRVMLGLGFGDRFGENAYAFGGGGSLRGYESDYVEGDAYVLGNIEYLEQIGSWPQLRGVLFADVGNVYPEVSHIDLTDLLAGAGLGLRWRVQSFVDVDLRLDVAYGFESGEVVTYAGTEAAF